MSDMVDRIADILIEDHVELMKENMLMREALLPIAERGEISAEIIANARAALERNMGNRQSAEIHQLKGDVAELTKERDKLREDIRDAVDAWKSGADFAALSILITALGVGENKP